MQGLFILLTEEERTFFEAKNAESYRDGIFEILENFGPICDDIASRARQIDDVEISLKEGKEQIPPVLKQNLDILKSYGFLGGSIQTQYGGYGIPFFCEMSAAEMLNRACPSTTITAHWFNSIARVIEKYGSKELCDLYIPQIARAEISGNMALTEPDAGSDLSQIKTYAVSQGDGTWKLYGTKRFITNGGAEISLVLAKTQKGAEGLDKLSLFLCPRYLDGKDNIQLLKIEKKVALHGSLTAELAYDGSVAYLLGEENSGFHYMLDLMNESRIGVASQALGSMEAIYRLAHTYANERKTWGKPIAHHELIAEKLLSMEVEIKAARSLSYETIFLQSMRNIIERRLRDGASTQVSKEALELQLKEITKELRQKTPLIKYWLSEKAVEHARIGLQIHGGYGFIQEYKAEWLLREVLIYPLYEGTSQIQALMCMKDEIKALLKKPRTLWDRSLDFKMQAIRERDPLTKQFMKLKEISWNALLHIVFKLMKENVSSMDWKSFKKNPIKMIRSFDRKSIQVNKLGPALLHAENFCELKCLEALAQSVLNDAKQDESRVWIAEHFISKSKARAEYLYTLIKSEDRVLKERLSGFDG
jgi:alkylation response protein AidB-like acyl-CoA dehydrogenase